jgi:hypothetical protein
MTEVSRLEMIEAATEILKKHMQEEYGVFPEKKAIKKKTAIQKLREMAYNSGYGYALKGEQDFKGANYLKDLFGKVFEIEYCLQFLTKEEYEKMGESIGETLLENAMCTGMTKKNSEELLDLVRQDVKKIINGIYKEMNEA